MLIAGGSGLVPLMSMLRHRRNAGSEAPAKLLVSAREADDVLYARELERIGVDVVLTYTRRRARAAGPATRAASTARCCRRSRCSAGAPTSAGRRTFVETVANHLVALGEAPADIRTERFGGG